MMRLPLLWLALFTCLFWATGVRADRYTVPLLVPATTADAPQGLLRVLNGTASSGAVSIYAIDDAGARSGPATFTLNASAAVEFTATDLQSGNASLGLTGGIGTDSSDARLEIHTDLWIVPLAFVRAADGTLSTMHHTVRMASKDGSRPYRYEVPVFNLSTEMTQVSRLRLINPGDSAAAVTVSGRDDSGAEAAGGEVTLTIAAGGAQTLTAQQLEAGDTALTGQLGAGTGKWRLTVSSDQPLQVVNLVASSAGYWNNLSTTAAGGPAPADHDAAAERFDGQGIVYETGAGRFTLTPMADDRFSETGESDGATTSYTGDYSYTAIGPDAGRLTLDYDDGDRCQANLYFSTRTGGWFASRCTGGDYPPEGTWLGGNWSVEGDEHDGSGTPTAGSLGECYPGLTLSIGQRCTYPGTTDEFSVNVRGRGSFLDRLAGIRIRISNETIDGQVVHFLASHQGDGVWRIDRTADTSPSFAAHTGPGDRTYTVGAAIDTLALPAASGGEGTLSYSLSPRVPGLGFDRTMRELTGTPTRAGAWSMTYAVSDVDGDSDSLAFRITVVPDTSPSFAADAGPVDRTYTVGTAIDTLMLPPASGGNGMLTYALSPEVPDLSFDVTTRALTGTPVGAGTYPMTYVASDADGDSASLAFRITVREPLTGGGGGGGLGGGGGFGFGGGGGGGGSGGGGGGGSGGDDGLRPGDTFTDTLASEGEGPTMVVIPAGSFRMGCLNDDGGCLTSYFPVHTVNVPRFALSKYEVTFAQWDACLDAGGCNGYRAHDRGWGRGNRPVMRIRWSDAQAYVAWLSQQTGEQYRLPSESEWEYAARAGTETRYHWGNGTGANRANCADCGSQWDGEMTAPVGSFDPNAWGLHDMHGNVLEWAADCNNSNYEGAPTDGSAWLSGDCNGRVVRSGGWDSDPRFIRAVYRSRADPDFIVDVIGFRVVRTLAQ